MVPVRGLRVHLLGGLDIEGLPALSIGSRKARALLRRLAVARGQAVPVADLLTVAWPTAAPDRGPEQLGVLASRLRRTLGPHRLIRGDAGYALCTDWLDLTALERGTAACAQALADRPARAYQLGCAALKLVRGPLLPEEAEAPWLQTERLYLDRLLTRLRLLTAEAALGSGATWEAAELARRCREDDPFNEVALRVLLRALAASGQVAAALSTYRQALEHVRAELGPGLSTETEELFLALLRQGRVPAG